MTEKNPVQVFRHTCDNCKVEGITEAEAMPRGWLTMAAGVGSTATEGRYCSVRCATEKLREMMPGAPPQELP
jgi:hypothetical protein